MLWTISMISLCLWLVGVITPSTLDGYIHILLALSVTTFMIRIFSRRQHVID